MSDPPHAAERVLIVEDDPATRSGLTELVRAWGFTAEAAGDGAEALEKVTAFRPSIIVTDLVMPNMSGARLGKEIQTRWPAIKLLFVSGFPRGEFRQAGSPVAGVPVLHKPFTSQQIVKAVRDLLDG